MNIKPEFTVGNLEFSETLPEEYTWDEFMAVEWPDGWRVPEEADLISLYKENPRAHFCDLYWSVALLADDDTFAWGVDFGNGYSYYDVRSRKHRVRLVREVSKPV